VYRLGMVRLLLAYVMQHGSVSATAMMDWTTPIASGVDDHAPATCPAGSRTVPRRPNQASAMRLG
jgi:hypothetical protein